MKIEKTNIKDLLIIQPDVFEDNRGYFFESYNRERFVLNGIEINFVQDSFSKSKYGTIRGLHYQAGESAQYKLCSVISGSVMDVVVDIRFGSPTFGKFLKIELSGTNKTQLLIPIGFAHGFSVMSKEAIFHYKVSSFYNPGSERCIRYNDPTLAIDWEVKNHVVSKKDQSGKLFKEINKEFTY